MKHRRPAPARMLRLSLLLQLTVCACSPSVAVPEHVQLSCTQDADCPTGYKCNVAVERCSKPGENSPPSASIGAVPRDLATVSVPVTIFDLEGDQVTLEVEADVGTGFAAITTDATPVAGSAAGVPVTIHWDAETALGSSAYRSGLRVRITPRDTLGVGLPATSDAFSFGNDAPAVTSFALDPGTGPGGAIVGLGVLRFTVADSSADPVEVSAVELSLAGDFGDADALPLETGFGAVFPAGNLAALGSSPAGIVHTLTWDSYTSAPVDQAGARVRLHVTDGLGGQAVAVSDPFILHNATNPPVVALVAPPSGTVSGVVELDYDITDPAGDLSSITVEYFDGSSWHPAASASPTASLAPGSHVYLWQSTELGLGVYTGVTLRLTVRANGETGNTVMTDPFSVDNRDQVGNFPPTLGLQTIEPAGGGRYLTLVEIPFVVSDPNGDAPRFDTVTVSVHFWVGPTPPDDPSAWYVPTAAASSPSLTGLAAAVAGSAHTFVWDALADALAGNGPLAVVSVDTDGDGTPDTDVVDATDAVLVRLDAVDSGTPSAGATGVVSSAFSIGNRPPGASSLTALGEGPAIPLLGIFPTLAGQVPIQFVLADPQGDLADADVDFSLVLDNVWRSVELSLGSRANLGTSPAGVQHLVVWSSTSPLDSSGGDQETIDQGTGPLTTSLFLRVRGKDHPAAGVTHFGPWLTVGQFPIVNQTPPRVEVDAVANSGGLYNGAVPIQYRIIDAQADLADVRFEFSNDDGSSWRRCTEYTAPQSEGTVSLASAPGPAGGGGGFPHTFIWDSLADEILSAPTARVRLTAADLGGVGASVEVIHLAPVGPTLVDPVAASFAPQLIVDSGGTPGGVAVADLDGDGILDLVVANNDTGSLGILLGGGSSGVWDGTFTPAAGSPYPASGSPLRLAVGDFNCDGFLDVAMTSVIDWHAGDSNAVDVYLGTGDGTMTPWTVLAQPASPASIAAADLDGDGHDDLVVGYAQSSPAIATYLAQGATGACTLGAAITQNLTTDAQGILVADFNGDGFPDLAVTGTTLHILSGRDPSGSGALFSESNTGLGAGPTAAVVDVDGDGIRDLLLWGGTPSWYVARGGGAGGVGDGTFTRVGSSFGPSDDTLSIMSVDFDADGLHDVAGASVNSHVLRIFRAGGVAGKADGTYSDVMELGLYTTLRNQVVSADLNADGEPDFIAGTNSKVVLYVSRPAGLFDSDTLATARLFPGGVGITVGAADMNGDGLMDVVASATMNGLVSFIGQGSNGVGNGMLVGRTAVSVDDGNPIDLALADFDGDGAMDAVVLGYDSTQAAFCADVLVAGSPGGMASGQLGPRPGSRHLLGAKAYAVHAADLDEDGKVDFVVITNPSDTSYALEVYLGNGDGSFAPKLVSTSSDTTPGARSAWAVTSGDFDGDGHLDLAIVGSQGLVVMHGAGDGSFTEVGSEQALGNLGAVAVADLDHDGALDLAVTANPAAGVRVLLGRGDGTFGDEQSYALAPGEGTAGLRLVDLNDDGILDLAVGCSGSELVRIFPGRPGCGATTPCFGSSSSYPTHDTATRGIVTGDYNNDGMMDVATLGFGSRTVSLLTGRRQNGRVGWARALRGAPLPVPGRNTVGDATIPLLTDAFGGHPDSLFALRHYHGAGDGLPGDRRAGGPRSGDFLVELQHARLPLPARLVAATDAWLATGDVALVRVPDDPTGGSRLCERARFGQNGSGLDLTAASVADQRGIIVDLPLRAGCQPGGGKCNLSRTVHVFQRTSTYLHAAAFPSDPGSGASNSASCLPRVFGGASWQDVIEERASYRELPQGSLTSGTGPRFVVESSDPQLRRVRVVTDQLGVLQAFVEP